MSQPVAHEGVAVIHRIGGGLGLAVLSLLAIALVTVAAIDPKNSAWGLAWLGFLVVGGFIAARQPHNRIGWLLVAVGAGFGLTVLQQWFVASRFGPGSAIFEASMSPIGALPWLALIGLITLFPTGRSNTRLQTVITKMLVILAVIVSIASLVQTAPLGSGRPNPFALEPIAIVTSPLLTGAGLLVTVLPLLIASLVSAIIRARKSQGVERLQFRWLIWAVSVSIAAIVLVDLNRFVGMTLAVAVLALNAIPVAIGVAVVRYHLYDIDRLVSRTTSYAVVTGLLLATYVVVATAVSTALPQSSALAVASATLAAAASARPMLRKVQTVVDRRFNRERYDSIHTVDAFGLGLRHEVDPTHVTGQLLAAVNGTLEPSTVGLWLRQVP